MTPYAFATEYLALSTRERYRADQFFEISKQRFWYYLECLPPIKWEQLHYWESFAVPEPVFSDYYTFCIQLGKKYYRVTLPISSTVGDIQAQLLAAINNDQVTRYEYPTLREAQSLLGLNRAATIIVAKYAREGNIDLRTLTPDQCKHLAQTALNFSMRSPEYPYEQDVITSRDVEDVYQSFVGAALWSTNDENGEPLDAKCDRFDIHHNLELWLRSYVTDFLLNPVTETDRVTDEQLGHDLWLTSQGHGSGFWDRKLGSLGDLLTQLAKDAVPGSFDLYVGDDNKIYFG